MKNLLLLCLFTVSASAATSPLTLERALALAAKNNPQLAAAVANWNAAEQRAIQSGKRLNPNLIIGTEGTPLNGTSAAKGDYRAGISQSIRLNGTAKLNRRIATVASERAALLHSAAANQIRQSVHSAFASALFAQSNERLFTDRIRLLATNAAMVKLLVKNGESVSEASEVAHAELDHEQLEYRQAQALRAKAFAQLATTIGQPDLNIPSVAGSLTTELGLRGIESAANEELPAVLAQDSTTEIMKLRAHLARASRIPNLNLGLVYRRVQSNRRDALDLQASVALPIFDNKRAAAKAFEADARAAEARGEQLRQQFNQQYRRSLTDLRIALKRAQHIRDEIMPHKERALRRREALFLAGESSRLEYTKAQLAFTEERRHHLDTLREVHRHWAQLQRFVTD
ncbi:MAG: TolC family protein [Limisphaerales bacterium]